MKIMHSDEPSGSIKDGQFLYALSDCYFSRSTGQVLLFAIRSFVSHFWEETH
jgi:hypothetical protein